MHSHPFFHYTHLSLMIRLESLFSDTILHACSSERDLKVHLLPKECLALSEIRHLQSISKQAPEMTGCAWKTGALRVSLWNSQILP